MFIFYQIDNKHISLIWNLLKADILDTYIWFKYSMAEEKHKDFMKNH